nr:uncharacterized protein LOC111415673 [Onthophagus taurus]
MTNTNNENIIPLLNTVSKNENISNPQYEITYSMKKGDGYLSVIYDAKIKNDQNQEVLSVITKISPENQIFREQTHIENVYKNEVLFYEEIYPAYCAFQKEKGLNLFDFAPKCYATTLESNKEALVLENLKDQGYKLWNRMVPMDANHIEFTLKAYAKLHGVSFAFKDQRREMFDGFRSKIVDIFEDFSRNDLHLEVFNKLAENTVNFFDPIKDEKYVNKFKDYIKTMPDFTTKFASRNMDEYGVIGHGDCWCNNMMYKYGDPKNNLKPTEIRFIDYQIIRYGSPVTDFSHFFYTSSSKSELDNIEYYRNIYYDELTATIKQLGSDPNELYPKSVFDAHWKKYCVNGLNVALFLIRMMTTEAEEIPEYNDLSEAMNVVEKMSFEPKNDGYKERVRDVVMHFYDKEYI